MDKINWREEFLEHHKQFLDFIQKLPKLDEQVLRQPMEEGKWSIVEVIGHFQLWDQFVIEKRLPFIFSNEETPASPKVEEVNAKAALRARNEPTHITFENFVDTRVQLLLDLLTILPEDEWYKQFQLNQKLITFYDYVKGLMEHDLLHKRVLEAFLNSKK